MFVGGGGARGAGPGEARVVVVWRGWPWKEESVGFPEILTVGESETSQLGDFCSW